MEQSEMNYLVQLRLRNLAAWWNERARRVTKWTLRVLSARTNNLSDVCRGYAADESACHGTFLYIFATSRLHHFSSNDWLILSSSFLQFLNVVPQGEQWIIESGGRFSKVAGPGINVLLPFIHKVKAVKAASGTTLGVLSRKAKSKTGEVDAYAVLYTQYSDFSKVAHHGGQMDGELELVQHAQKVMADAVAEFSSPLSDADRASLSAKVKAGVAARAAEVGLTVENVEFRDAWPVSSDMPARLVSLEKPPRPTWDHTHHLSNDYWSEVMPPLFFTKYRYGNLREPETSTAGSLEWCLPSPPEFHHYHAGVPKSWLPFLAIGFC